MHLFLVGPMGSGKTEVGRELSSRTGLPFIDIDKLVEERLGMTVSEVFRTKGEEAFRDAESGVLEEVAAGEEAVVACGGGAVLRAENISIMRRGGMVVYLRVSPEEAARRIGSARGRPLLEGAEDMALRLGSIMGNREMLYRGAAHAEVDTDGRLPREVAEEVERIWRSCS